MSTNARLRIPIQFESPYVSTLIAELRLIPRVATKVAPALLAALLRPNPTLLTLVQRWARRTPRALAFEMGELRLTWSDVDALTSKVARALVAYGVRAGDPVVLMGKNSPLYLALVLGITRLGATAVLVGPQLTGGPLAHALRTSRARLALVEAPFVAHVERAHHDGGSVIAYGTAESPLERCLGSLDAAPFPPARVGKDDDFVYIFTSGTTGFPKLCRVSHARAITAGVVFGGALFEFRPGDKLYAPLPLHHSSALLIGAGSAIAYGVPMALRDAFSARHFIEDVRRYGATTMLYIGEVCRYLLATPPCADDRRHRLRVAVGNGLRPDVWGPFRDRFGIAKIREFYAATEAPGVLFNLAGIEGSVGHMPLDLFGLLRLAKFDVAAEEHVRDARGFCIPAADDEPGELLIKLPRVALLNGLRYRGYTDPVATEAKVLTDVFRTGDRYFRTGDLLRRNRWGLYAFVDRIGDTFRCKGENVSTSEVVDTLAKAPGVAEVTVVGVRVPSYDGQFGLAVVVPESVFDPDRLFEVAQELPRYAQPYFVRIRRTIETTSTHKHQKGAFRREGADPRAIADALYVRGETTYVPLTPERYDRIVDGTVRL